MQLAAFKYRHVKEKTLEDNAILCSTQAKAAVATRSRCPIVREVHKDLDIAVNDRQNMISLAHLQAVLKQVLSTRAGLEVATPVYLI